MSEREIELFRTPPGPDNHVLHVGECIYCGCREGLSNEHIIPYALGGNVVLDHASCRECAKATTRFERLVTRGFMYNARIVAGLPTRRPSQMPKQVTFEVKKNGTIESVSVPTPDGGALMFLPRLSPPGMLVGRPRVKGVEVVGYEAISFGKTPDELVHAVGGDAYHISALPWDVNSYARLIAKIAWGFAVAKIGLPLPPRSEVPLVPIILGSNDDASVWMGTMEYTSPLEAERPLHVVSTYWAGDPERTGQDMLVSRVKLFANSNASGLGVIVWRPDAPDPRAPTRRP